MDEKLAQNKIRPTKEYKTYFRVFLVLTAQENKKKVKTRQFVVFGEMAEILRRQTDGIHCRSL